MRTLQSRHTVIRADQFDPDGWQLPGITDLCQNNDEGCATNCMSVIAHVYQTPQRMDDDTPVRDHDPAPTRSCRPRQKTTSNGNGPARSQPTNLPTSSPRFKSGTQTHGAFQNRERDIGRALVATNPGETQRHGTLWTIKQWKRLAHYMVYVRCAAFFDTLSREFLMLIPMGRSEDIQLALRRREQRDDEGQEEQCCERPGGSVGARQSLAERQPGNRGTLRRRTTAVVHRLRSRREATLRCTANDARCVGIGGSAFP